MIVLQGLSSFCGIDNQSGLLTIEYAPVSWVNTNQYAQITNNHNWQKDIGFVSGVPGWLTAKVLRSRNLWNEKHNRTDQGPVYEQTVSAVIPYLKPTSTGELQQMDLDEYLIKLVDQNGARWLLGSIDHPFQFFCDGTVGTDGGLNNYAIRFVSNTKFRAFGFLPSF